VTALFIGEALSAYIESGCGQGLALVLRRCTLHFRSGSMLSKNGLEERSEQ
jgi:hypothetical protein